MTADFILAHDVGTSGTKSSVVKADGVIEIAHSNSHDTTTPQPGWAEQNPRDWWTGVCANTRALMAERPELRNRIAAIGVSGHMLGCVAVDDSGNPLRPAMLHSDTRAAAESAVIAERIGADNLYRTTGNILDPRSPLAKVLWLQKNEPDVYANTNRFLQSKDYIVGCMVGAFDSTDYSDASHAQFLDIRRKRYAENMLEALDVDRSKLPALHAATDLVGTLTDTAAADLGLGSGIPVVAGGGDGSCATVGAGAVNTGDAYCCIGTTAWIAATVATPVIDPERRVFNLMSLDGESCGVFGTVQAAGRSLDWIMNLFGEPSFDQLDNLLTSVDPGSGGLVFLPYLEGERSPIYDTNARGVFFGLTPAHKQQHLVRATVEGVSFGLRSVLDVLRESTAVPALRLIGGGGQSNVWQQMLADVANVTVQTLSTRAADATSLGAAIAAGVGVGLIDSMADGVRAITVTQERSPAPELAGRYDELYEIYASLYPPLKPVYAALQRWVTGT